MKQNLWLILVLIVFELQAQPKRAEADPSKATYDIDLNDLLNSIQNAIDSTAQEARKLGIMPPKSIELEMEIEASQSKEVSGKFFIKAGYKKEDTRTTTVTYKLLPNAPKDTSLIALENIERKITSISPIEVARSAIEKIKVIKSYNNSHKNPDLFTVNTFSYTVNFKVVKTGNVGLELSILKSVELSGGGEKSHSYSNKLTFNYCIYGKCE